MEWEWDYETQFQYKTHDQKLGAIDFNLPCIRNFDDSFSINSARCFFCHIWVWAMSEQRADYQAEVRHPFDMTQAEINLILRLRQHRGMIIVDGDSMCLWAAGKLEQCNGRRTRLSLEVETT